MIHLFFLNCGPAKPNILEFFSDGCKGEYHAQKPEIGGHEDAREYGGSHDRQHKIRAFRYRHESAATDGTGLQIGSDRLRLEESIVVFPGRLYLGFCCGDLQHDQAATAALPDSMFSNV